MNTVTTLEIVAYIKEGAAIIGQEWAQGPTITLNPAHIVSQVPFTWDDTEGRTITGLKVRTVLDETFYLETRKPL